MVCNPRIAIVAPEAPQRRPHSAGVAYLTALVSLLTRRGAQVTVIAPSTPATRAAALDADGWEVIIIPLTPVLTRGIRGRLIDMAVRLAYTRPPHGFMAAVRAHPEALAAIRNANVIDAQWPMMATVLPQLRRMAPDARIIATLHDVASQSNLRHLHDAHSFPSRVRFASNIVHTKYIEGRASRTASAMIVFSEKDRGLLPRTAAAEVVYPPLASQPHERSTETHALSVGAPALFVGPLYRAENRDGLEWFAREVWPQVRSLQPAARVIVAGHADPAHRKPFESTPGLEFVGFVEDLDPLYASAAAAIAPLRLGAGVKFKVIDAMARGIPVIGTSVAWEGIGDDTHHPTPVDSASGFARALTRVLSDPAASRANAHIWQRWTNARYAPSAFERRIAAIYQLQSTSANIDGGCFDGEPRS